MTDQLRLSGARSILVPNNERNQAVVAKFYIEGNFVCCECCGREYDACEKDQTLTDVMRDLKEGGCFSDDCPSHWEEKGIETEPAQQQITQSPYWEGNN